MDCRDGQMTFRELRVNVPVKASRLDGKPLPCSVKSADGLTVLEFQQPLTLEPGEMICLERFSKTSFRGVG